jgi:hypothetical protein
VIIDGIRVSRIRVPKQLRGLYTAEWPDREKHEKLLLKLASQALMRWSLAPDEDEEFVPTGNGSGFRVTRRLALFALETVYLADQLLWAQVEIEFQRRHEERELSESRSWD